MVNRIMIPLVIILLGIATISPVQAWPNNKTLSKYMVAAGLTSLVGSAYFSVRHPENENSDQKNKREALAAATTVAGAFLTLIGMGALALAD